MFTSKRRMYRCVLIFAAIFFFRQSEGIYVSTFGNDTAACGSVDAPCRTILWALDSNSFSGTISLFPGLYEGQDNCGFSVNTTDISFQSYDNGGSYSEATTLACNELSMFGGGSLSLFGISFVGNFSLASKSIDVQNCSFLAGLFSAAYGSTVLFSECNIYLNATCFEFEVSTVSFSNSTFIDSDFGSPPSNESFVFYSGYASFNGSHFIYEGTGTQAAVSRYMIFNGQGAFYYCTFVGQSVYMIFNDGTNFFFQGITASDGILSISGCNGTITTSVFTSMRDTILSCSNDVTTATDIEIVGVNVSNSGYPVNVTWLIFLETCSGRIGISDSFFVNNTAVWSVLYVRFSMYCQLVDTDVQFYFNTFTNNTAGISTFQIEGTPLSQTLITITSCMFYNNIGGATNIASAYVNFDGCYFIENQKVDSSGGAVSMTESHGNFTWSHFAHNVAAYASTIHLQSVVVEYPVTFTNCDFHLDLFDSLGTSTSQFQVEQTASLFLFNSTLVFNTGRSSLQWKVSSPEPTFRIGGTGYLWSDNSQFIFNGTEIMPNVFPFVKAIGGVESFGTQDTGCTQATFESTSFSTSFPVKDDDSMFLLELGGLCAMANFKNSDGLNITCNFVDHDCPVGTTNSSDNNCDYCPVGMFQISSKAAGCVPCSPNVHGDLTCVSPPSNLEIYDDDDDNNYNVGVLINTGWAPSPSYFDAKGVVACYSDACQTVMCQSICTATLPYPALLKCPVQCVANNSAFCSEGYSDRLCSKCACYSDADCFFLGGPSQCVHCAQMNFSGKVLLAVAVVVLLGISTLFARSQRRLVKLILLAIVATFAILLLLVDYNHDQDWWAFSLVFMVFFVEFQLLYLRRSLSVPNHEKSDADLNILEKSPEKDTPLVNPSGAAKILLFFMQVTSLLNGSVMPSKVSALLRKINTMSNHFEGLECSWDQIRGEQGEAVKFALNMLLPIFVLVVFAFLVGLQRLVRKINLRRQFPNSEKRPLLANIFPTAEDQFSFTTVIVVVLYVFHVDFARRASQIFRCDYDTYANAGFMNAFPWIECSFSEEPYLVTLILGVLFFAAYAVGIPCFFLALLFKNRDKIKRGDRRTFQRYGMLYENYNPKYFYFEPIWIFRNLILVVVATVLPSESSFQRFSVLVVLFASIFASCFVNVFNLKTENGLYCLSVGVITSTYAAQFRSNHSTSEEGSFAWVILAVHIATAFLICFCTCWHMIRRKMRIFQ
eukprot:TRINITY_DN3541_c0_g1_i7.p1 TRINITY_DN3541_c0_g1~~TRINITY_DN3541_c0_g1_i7.p1  ORF type:complete len:1225 (+),score=158.72 TRINITY_DN3541_c0_g1_i7:44-3718(+)